MKHLQDVFTDRKVDAPFRDRVPMVCRKDEVLLIAGVTAGNLPPADEKRIYGRCAGKVTYPGWTADMGERR